jgi:hypothetical protein
MPRASDAPKGGTFTFRLDPRMKAALTRAAADEHKQPGELIRALLEDHLAQKQRRSFEEEARRQCMAINMRARESGSDEAAVMRELDANLDTDDFGDEWTA